MNLFVCDGRAGGHAEARRLRHRAAAERHARHHRAHDEPDDRAERPARSRRAQVAGARRRLPGGAAAGDADQGRRAASGSAPRTSAGCRCSDHLKEIVHRCIGERRKRYESADEMIEALRNPPRALQGRRAANAEGRAPRLHRDPDASRAARRSARRSAPARSSTAGRRRRRRSSCAAGPTRSRRRAATRGLKLMEIKRLREKGHRITLLNEAQFWRLATRA